MTGRYLIQRNDERALDWPTLRGAIDHARRLQLTDPSALVTIADTHTRMLVLGWWALSDEAIAAEDRANLEGGR